VQFFVMAVTSMFADGPPSDARHGVGDRQLAAVKFAVQAAVDEDCPAARKTRVPDHFDDDGGRAGAGLRDPWAALLECGAFWL